jgi:hypothetical protein
MKGLLMQRFLPTLLVLLVVGFTGSAQSQPEDSELNPEAIFAEGIEWTVVEAPPPWPVSRDSERQVIRVLDGEVWREFPYPPGVEYIDRLVLQSDGLVYVKQGTGDLPSFRSATAVDRAASVWLLDPNTGEYSRPPAVCDGLIVQAEEDEAGIWTVAFHSLEEDPFLCHSGTGEMRDVLPEGLGGWSVFQSEDASHVIMTARDWNDSRDFRVFGYSVAEDVTTDLGSIDPNLDSVLYLCNWLTATKGVLCLHDPRREWPATLYYAFDVTQPDSITFAFPSWHDNTMSIEDPPRYVSMFAQSYAAEITGSRSDTPCTITVLDAEQLFELEVGHDCLPTLLNSRSYAPFLRHEDTLYFLAVERADSTTSTLQSYDMRTLAHISQIAGGELETILSVSPDGQYVVVLTNDNFSLDFPTYLRPFCCPESDPRQILIFNTNWSYSAPVYRSEPVGIFGASQVVWLDERTVVIATIAQEEMFRIWEGDGILDNIASSLRRITFNEDFGITTVIDTRYGLTEAVMTEDRLALETSPNNRYWLRGDHTVLRLHDFQLITLLQEGVQERYRIQTQWLENGDLEVRVANTQTTRHFRITLD